MQNVFLAADDDGVSRIVPALVAGYHVKAVRQKINNLAFALVAPLGADDNQICHEKRFQASVFPVCDSQSAGIFHLRTKQAGNDASRSNAKGYFNRVLQRSATGSQVVVDHLGNCTFGGISDDLFLYGAILEKQ
jgi:hypothetical protein